MDMVGFYKTSAGMLASVFPSLEHAEELAAAEGMSLEEACRTIISKAIPAGSEAIILEHYPSLDARWRDAWDLEGSEVVVNPERAVMVAQTFLRLWRGPEFAKNDIRIQNALADGNEQARIEAVAYRDYLRDLPQQCEGKTVEELKAFMIDLGVVGGER